MPYGTIAADVIQSSVANTSLGAGNASIMKNRIINGAMVIDQRNAGASVTPASGAVTYTLDRWNFYVTQASKLTTQQSSTAPAGFTKSMLITSSSAYSVTSTDRFQFTQPIEGYNIADLGWGTANAKTVTLSFQVYSSLTGTFGGSIKNATGARSYPFTYTISSANTWTTISVTVAGDTSGTWSTDNSGGILITFGIGVGSTFSGTAGSWASANYDSATGATSVVGTSGATFYITGVQLEVGSSATGYEYRQYGQELALCQRYYQTTGNGANPVGTGGGGFFMPLGVALAFAQGNTSFRVTMRANPTITLYDGNGLAGSVTQHGSADGITATAGGITQNGFMQVQRSSGSFNGSAGYPVTCGYTASIEL